MKKIIYIAPLALAVWLLVGIICEDNEFYESAALFIKIPPTAEMFFCEPVIDSVQNREQCEMMTDYSARLHSYRSMGMAGELLALALVELLLAALFIRPVFSGKPKYIAADIALFALGSSITYCSFHIWIFYGALYRPVWYGAIYVAFLLAVHFVLMRLVRPVGK